MQPPTSSEATRTQHSPDINTGTLAIPDLEGSIDLVLLSPPQLPDKAAEPPDHLLKQTQAPINFGGLSELLLGERLWHAMGQTNLALPCTSKGKSPVIEAHSQPPDFSDLQMQGSTTWELESIDPKAHVHMYQVQRPVFDKGASTCPDPWPSLGIITINLAGCLGSASQLEGEQNFHILCMGSELHAAPTAPHLSSSSSLLFLSNTLTHENPPREGAASEWHVTNTCPEHWHPSDLPYEEGAATKWHVTNVHCSKPLKPSDP